MTILVLGATGKTGRRLVPRLRANGVEVRAASRSGETRFDWHDRSTWADAVRGVTAVYVVAPEEPEVIEPFVTEAVAAGVRRFAVLSGRGIDRAAETLRPQPDGSPGVFGPGMVEAERAVVASGAEWTILRANNFDQNFSEDVWAAPITAGRLALPMGAVGEPFVDIEDVAGVAAAVLTQDGHSGRIYDISGPESLTFAEATEVIGALTKPIEYVELTPEQYVEELVAEGYPDEFVHILDAMFTLMRAGHLSKPADGVEQVLGRRPGTFAAYAERVFAGSPSPEGRG
ncbi:NAD(P)H-binding protein [Kribbella sp. CA-253562]|uniref:NAD(P)H-binding protein n=1 Tax=Kribbella sp. CA-253562 TaxID=3239942 RepID=UPI003D943276